ncbi:unnamed protein product [Meganyctiphanes norvegica]|uniref:Uncharacterized protein n=1 Tax=Meganyctiphanes norvegica TaxID=48144 RepID=A0AAV2QF16_MEGNR
MDSNGQQSGEPIYCRKGCGFFGHKDTDRLCSKCYRDEMKKKQKTEPSETTTSASLTSSILTSTQLSAIATTQSSNTPAVSSSSSNSPAVITSSAVSAALSEALSTKASSPSPQQATSLSTVTETQGSSTINSSPSDKVSDGASSSENASTSAAAAATAASTESSPTPNEGAESPATTRKKNKCQVCRKKVGLTGFTCRCGGLFCPLHRYNNEHNCTFDYRQYGQDEIRRNNPAVKGEKIRKM